MVFAACTSAGMGSCFGPSLSLPTPRKRRAPPRLADNLCVSVDWSPDGSRIVIDDGQDIWTVPADGTGGPVPLVTAPGNNGGASSSPDGRRLAFISDRDGSSEMYVMNADGTGQTRLTDNPRPPGPVWAPEGPDRVSRRDATRPGASRHPHGGRRRHERDAAHERRAGRRALDAGPDWQPIPGPQRSDYKNGAEFCKAEREFLGEAGFRQKYGGGANAYGKCVSGSRSRRAGLEAAWPAPEPPLTRFSQPRHQRFTEAGARP